MMTTLKKLLCILLSTLMITTTAPIASFLTVWKADSITANAETIYETTETYTSKDYRWKYQILYTDDNDQDYIQVTSYQGIFSTATVPAKIDGKIVKGISKTFAGSDSRLKNVTLSEGIEFIDSRAFYSNPNYITVNLPSTLKYIASEAFYLAKIQKLNFSSGLEAIGIKAFEESTFSNEELTLPDSLQAIGYSAFHNTSINSIHFGKNVRIALGVSEYSKIYGKYSVEYADNEKYNIFAQTTGIKQITVDDENPYLMADGNGFYTKDKKILYKFFSCDANSIDTYCIDENVETINSYAFYDTINIIKIVLNKNLVEILPYAFYSSKIGNIEFCSDGNLETISNYAFKSLQSASDIIIPSSVKTIGSYAFSESTIYSLSFNTPSNCITIGSYAFYKCSNLKSVFIPSSVTSIGNASTSYAFSNCTMLNTFIIEDNSMLTNLGIGIFENCKALKSFKIGDDNNLESINAQFSDTVIEELNLSGCTKLSSICQSCFENSKYLTTIDLSNTQLADIKAYTFSHCTSLDSVILSPVTETIGEYAFYGCTALNSINIENVAKVDTTSFENCPNLDIDLSDKIEKNYEEFIIYKAQDHVIISGYTGNESDLVIPDVIQGLPVTKIAEKAFYGKKFNSVKFSSNLITIENEAFYNCGIIEPPVFPNSLISVGEKAFDMCRFSGKLVLPKNLETISKYAFAHNSSSEIIVGENTKTVCEYAFYGNNNLESIDFGEGVVTIDETAVSSCYMLKEIHFGKNVSDFGKMFNTKSFDSPLESITVNKENPYFCTVDGVLYNKTMTDLIYYPSSMEIELFTVPKTVETIWDYAFYYSFAHAINLSNTSVIGEYAFAYSQCLTEIYIPSSVTSMGDYCFAFLPELEQVTFGAVNVDDYTDALFFTCPKLKTVEFDPKARIKGMSRTFCKTIIESISLPDNVDYMTSTFLNVTTLKEIILPKNLVNLGSSTLSSTSIEKIILPNNTETISEQAFANCSMLAYVDLANVTTIEKQAFENCTALESIDLTGIWSLSKYAFIGCNSLKKLYFTKEEKEAYITENEFQGNETIETVVIGNSVTEIQDYAFAECKNLETAFIADSVTDIADTAFAGCENLTIVCMSASYASAYAAKNSISYTTLIVDPIPDQAYTGKPITPTLTVRAGTSKLKLNEDYKATYSDNINPGTAKATVVGLGDYSIFGTLSRFNIIKTNTEKPTTKPDTNPGAGTGTETNGSGNNTASSSTSNSNAGTTANKSNNSSTAADPSSKKETASSNSSTANKTNSSSKATVKTVKLSKTVYIYDGKVKKPGVTVKNSLGKTLKKGTDYTVKYASGRKNVGRYAVKITFKGNYKGCKILYFKILPKSTSISKVTAKSKGFTVQWKKQKTQVSGYQIQYSTSKKFTSKKTKSITIKSNKSKSPSKAVKNLKSKKTYYIRIRTYKTVKLKGKNVKIYSKWSTVKKVKTK